VVHFKGRTEEGKGMGHGGDGRCPFYMVPREAEEEGNGGSVARRNTWKEGEGWPGPDRWAASRPAVALSEQGSTRPLTRGPQPIAGGRGKGEARGCLGWSRKKRSG
jgi:hypothetical protein